MPETSTHIATSAANRQRAEASPIGRRALFAGAALLAGAPAADAASGGANPDAELIVRCHRFAEMKLAECYEVYRAEADFPDDFYDSAAAEVEWIEDTPAATIEGCRAKALAWSAWHSGRYDYPTGGDTLIVAVMRDLAGPDRAGILTRLVERFGPLPGREVGADGRWREDRLEGPSATA